MEDKHINTDEAKNAIEKLINEGTPQEVGIFISMLSYRYMQVMGITKEQFMTSLSNSIDKLGEKQN